MNGDATVYPPELPLLDRYRVDGTLGEGGLGTVVRAYDTRLKRTVAIKTLRRTIIATDPERTRVLEERFAREAEAGSRMGTHPNIVAVYDLVIAPDHTQYLILEYIAGGTLADRLKNGPLPLVDALRLSTDAAKGLGAAHKVDIVHRDVKPANLFLAADGRAQVGDFGIAQIDDLSGRTHTTIGHPGTPLYMSPEQSSSTGYMRPATDQFSLGLVLFEMITGKAYKRLGTREVAAALGTLPPPLAAVVERMTASDPDNRYPDMDAVIAALAAVDNAGNTNPLPRPRRTDNETQPFPLLTNPVIKPLPEVPPEPQVPTPIQEPAISRRAVLIGGAIVAVGGASAAVLAATHRDTPLAVATATVQSGITGVPLSTPTTVVVALGGSATAGATMSATMAATASSTPGATAPSATQTPPPTVAPTTVSSTATLAPPAPTLMPPPATPQPTPTVTLAPPTPTVVPPTATPQLLRPGTIAVPTAFPVVVTQVQERFRNLPQGTSVVFTDLGTNDNASVNADQVVPAAALIDIFVIAEAYHQVEAKMLSLDTVVPIPKNPVGGTGVLQRRPGGTTTVSEMITLIATESDNLAANLLMDQVGTDRVNQTIQVFGLATTQLRRHLGDDDARKRGIENVTTAKDMALFFNLIARGQVYTSYVSTALITAMGQQQKPEWDYLGSGLMPRPQIVHMPGQLPPSNGDSGVLHDVGIVYYGKNDAYVLAFLNQSTAPNRDVGIGAGQLSADVYHIVTGK